MPIENYSFFINSSWFLDSFWKFFSLIPDKINKLFEIKSETLNLPRIVIFEKLIVPIDRSSKNMQIMFYKYFDCAFCCLMKKFMENKAVLTKQQRYKEGAGLEMIQV